MANIETLHEMRRAGYKFLSHAKCKSCGAEIEWWQTNNDKKIPFNPMPPSDDDQTTAHFVTCPNADDHRKPKEQKRTTSRQATFPFQIEQLREQSDARIIVAIWSDGTGTVRLRAGLDPEDLRQDVITLANKMRNHLLEGKLPMMPLNQQQLLEMSPTDERNARIIALLLVTAKMLQGTTRETLACNINPARTVNAEVIKHFMAFLNVAIELHGEGTQLEHDALALAAELGFQVDQHHVSEVAHA